MVVDQKTILSCLLKYMLLRIFFIFLLLLIFPFYQGHATKYADTTGANTQATSDLIARCDTGNFTSTACDIAEKMISLPPSNIATFGLANQGSTVIEETIQLLDNWTLTKVFQSITTEELAQIRQKLTNQTFDNIIPEPLRERLLNRLSFN
jgi:hypothetical protein